MFCFACIEGLKDCPICGGAITGWGRTGPRKKPGPTRIGTKFDGDHRAVPANIVQVEAKSPDCPALEAEKADNFANDSSDVSDSDSDNDLVKWCGSEEFSNRGARSHQDLLESEVLMQEIESEFLYKSKLDSYTLDFLYKSKLHKSHTEPYSFSTSKKLHAFRLHSHFAQ